MTLSSGSSGPDLKLDEIEAELVRLRSKLALGAPIVPLASVRARDRGEPTHGTLIPFGLASSLLFDEQFGEYTAMDKPRIYLFEGTLAGRHIPSLVPIFEEIARERSPLVIAASEVDEDVLAMVALNKRRGSMRGALLLPARSAHPAALHVLQRVTGAGLGVAHDGNFRIEPPASIPRALATLYEVVLLGAPRLPTDMPSLGLLHVGGEDITAARQRARAARDMIARSRLS